MNLYFTCLLVSGNSLGQVTMPLEQSIYCYVLFSMISMPTIYCNYCLSHIYNKFMLRKHRQISIKLHELGVFDLLLGVKLDRTNLCARLRLKKYVLYVYTVSFSYILFNLIKCCTKCRTSALNTAPAFEQCHGSI